MRKFDCAHMTRSNGRFSLSLRFADTAFDLSFADGDLAEMFASSFHDAIAFEHTQRCIRLFVDGIDRYRVYQDGVLLSGNLDVGELAFRFSVTFGETLRAAAKGNICSAHASSSIIGSTAVSLMGASGSGKSTLSLLLSRFGKYIGDEYAFIDLDVGTICHEPYPVQIKEGSIHLLPWVDCSPYLTLSSERRFSSTLVPLDKASGRRLVGTASCRLGALIFPRYRMDVGNTCIRRLDAFDMPSLILQSIKNDEDPSSLMKRFIRMVGRENLPILSVEFSDGWDAALRLADCITRFVDQ